MRNAIVGLVRGYEDFDGYKSLIRRNELLHSNFNKRFNYDVIIFHEGDIKKEHQNRIKEFTPNIKFIDVSDRAFKVSQNIDYSKEGLGYKHMCRFYAVQIYDYLKEYDYYMRLDDDSYIMSEIGYDIFKFMYNNNIYGYRFSKLDGHAETIRTLPKATLRYVKVNNINIKCSIKEINHQNFYNNFHISRLDFWRREDVRFFLKYIDQQGGIYRHRWGDSTIQALAVKMFAEPDQIYQFNDFDYYHASHEKIIVGDRDALS